MKAIRIAAMATLAALVLGLLAEPASAQSSVRAGRWEGYGSLRSLFSESLDFEGGSTIDTDNDLGFALGFGYNFDDHLNVSGEFSWNSVDYDGRLASADSPGISSAISGQFDAASMAGTVTWHLLDGPLTPYGSATLGYTWIDTNIATGPPVTGCWWDPWFGYICDTFVDTKNEDAFSYGLGIGMRWDLDNGLFGRLAYDERWMDLSNADGTPSFGTVHLDFGGKF